MYDKRLRQQEAIDYDARGFKADIYIAVSNGCKLSCASILFNKFLIDFTRFCRIFI